MKDLFPRRGSIVDVPPLVFERSEGPEKESLLYHVAHIPQLFLNEPALSGAESDPSSNPT